MTTADERTQELMLLLTEQRLEAAKSRLNAEWQRYADDVRSRYIETYTRSPAIIVKDFLLFVPPIAETE